ncbi:glycosyltransferase [Alteromonas sp. ASW11-36]|uniref:Glycosyltransferase n=1 Tax=Alteromonas arenosi TaxID=3055817 RepID=A0ABT7SVB5_9ALTE|nr:glycosyltransferase [Alteromonas sp. ASW11-36]MDM7860139.1 glycosyltransferase [Alteromonas sp. ASW11-36]
MTQPYISIVVPAFNAETSVSATLCSIVNQTAFEQCELIVVNDGSTDSTPELVERTLRDIPNSRLLNQSNKGLGGARNTGVSAATGSYVMFVDSDDQLAPLALQKLLTIIHAEHPDIIEFDYERRAPDGQYIWRMRRSVTGNYARVLRCESDSSACSRVFSLALFKDYGIGFPEHRVYEDLATSYKLYWHANNVQVIKEPLYHYYVAAESLTNVLSDKNIEDMFWMLEQTREWLANQEEAEPQAFKKRLALCALALVKKLDNQYSAAALQRFEKIQQRFMRFGYKFDDFDFFDNIDDQPTLLKLRQCFYSASMSDKVKHDSGGANEAALLRFSKQLNTVIEQLTQLQAEYHRIVLYGNSHFRRLITPLLEDSVICTVDLNYQQWEFVEDPRRLKQLEYDVVLICVLGREQAIRKYLTSEVGISDDKIKQIYLIDTV